MVTTPVPVEGGRGGWRAPHERRYLVPWAQEAERIGVPAPHHGGGPGCGEARDQGEVAILGVRAHPIRQTTTPAPASGVGSPPSCSSAPATANAPGVAHVVPGGRDPAVGALDVRDAELVDVAVERIGDTAHMPADAEGT
jgi:hypothetical protein